MGEFSPKHNILKSIKKKSTTQKELAKVKREYENWLNRKSGDNMWDDSEEETVAEKNKKYSAYLDAEGNYFAHHKARLLKALHPAMFNLRLSQQQGIYFEIDEIHSDEIIDLPSAEYEQVVGEIEFFLKPDTKKSFKEYGFLYKRSAILFGAPGSGKTIIANRVAKTVIEQGGIVLFNPNPQLLIESYKIINDIEPNRLIMVIFEEFEELLDDYEGDLLSVLDGEIQKNNVIYLATTNHIEKVPARLMRPGRFSSVIEVHFPTKEARRVYLEHKMPGQQKKINKIVEVTDGFSIDEVKEIVLATECLKIPLDTVVKRIKRTQEIHSKLLNSKPRLEF